MFLFVPINCASTLIFPCFIQLLKTNHSYQSSSKRILNFLFLGLLSFLICIFLNFTYSTHEISWNNIVSFIVFAFNFNFYILILNFICTALFILHFYVCFIWFYFHLLFTWFFIKQNWALMLKLRLFLRLFLFFDKNLWFLSHEFFLSLIPNKLLINFLIV